MDVEARVEALQARNEILQARVEQLEAAMGMDLLPPVEWMLTATEARILGVLMVRECATKDAIMAALYRDVNRDEAQIKIVDVFVCKMRSKLRSFGIQILTRWSVGYYLTPETKAAIATNFTKAAA